MSYNDSSPAVTTIGHYQIEVTPGQYNSHVDVVHEYDRFLEKPYATEVFRSRPDPPHRMNITLEIDSRVDLAAELDAITEFLQSRGLK